MRAAIIKRSVKVRGHKTSVSLEDEFWEALQEIAERERLPVWKIVQAIDLSRHNANLSSAIRVFVLKHFRGEDKSAGRAAGISPLVPEATAASS